MCKCTVPPAPDPAARAAPIIIIFVQAGMQAIQDSRNQDVQILCPLSETGYPSMVKTHDEVNSTQYRQGDKHAPLRTTPNSLCVVTSVSWSFRSWFSTQRKLSSSGLCRTPTPHAGADAHRASRGGGRNNPSAAAGGGGGQSPSAAAWGGWRRGFFRPPPSLEAMCISAPAEMRKSNLAYPPQDYRIQPCLYRCRYRQRAAAPLT